MENLCCAWNYLKMLLIWFNPVYFVGQKVIDKANYVLVSGVDDMLTMEMQTSPNLGHGLVTLSPALVHQHQHLHHPQTQAQAQAQQQQQHIIHANAPQTQAQSHHQIQHQHSHQQHLQHPQQSQELEALHTLQGSGEHLSTQQHQPHHSVASLVYISPQSDNKPKGKFKMLSNKTC